MVKKVKNDSNLTINTAVKKPEAKKASTVVNLSRTIAIPVTYSLNGAQTSFMLPPSSKQVLPEDAVVVTQDKNIKVV